MTAKVMKVFRIDLLLLPRAALVNRIQGLEGQLEEKDTNIAILTKELSGCRAELDKHLQEKIRCTTNQPSSKQPEFNKDTGSEKKKRKKSRKHNGRKGAGNKAKPCPEVVNENPLTICPSCGRDLSMQAVVGKTSRIVEDITVPEKTVISQEIQERKWCASCGKVVASASEAALPQSDIGIKGLSLVAYLWVVSAISMPGIVAFLKSFFRLALSTAGISSMMIRLAKMLAPVYEEILADVKGGKVIFADETGWRIKGALHWLWIFANDRAAYYFPSAKRGSEVVAKILGEVFSGVLVTDAWHAYAKIICFKQTCMAHILRKIRKFRDAYPQYYSIFKFHMALKRLLRDGEKLKEMRKDIGKEVFARRLDRLKERLRLLLAWRNPEAVLKTVIAKVARQQAHILTFVEHEGVPSHNNYGEYIIKKGVLKRKVSGGSMSLDGAEAYAVLQSIAQTCHLRQLSFIGYLSATCLNFIRTGKPLSLKDYEASCTTYENQKAA